MQIQRYFLGMQTDSESKIHKICGRGLTRILICNKFFLTTADWLWKACSISVLFSKIHYRDVYCCYFVSEIIICWNPSGQPDVLMARPIQCRHELTANPIICGLMRTQNFWISTSLYYVPCTLKPKFHYADFVTKWQTQIMKVCDTIHVVDFQDLRRGLLWFVSATKSANFVADFPRVL